MAMFKVHKTKDFTVMSNHHLKNKGLSLKAKGLLSLMLSLPEDWDYSIKGLETITGEGSHSIKTALSELKKEKYITIERDKNYAKTSGKFKYVYNIYEKPFDSVEDEYFEEGDSPQGDFPHTVNPSTDNPLLLNTKEQNTNIKIKSGKPPHKKELVSGLDKNKLLDGLTSKQKSIYNGVAKNIRLLDIEKDLIESIEEWTKALLVNKKATSNQLVIDAIKKAKGYSSDSKVVLELFRVLTINAWRDINYAIRVYENDNKTISNGNKNKDQIDLDRKSAENEINEGIKKGWEF